MKYLIGLKVKGNMKRSRTPIDSFIEGLVAPLLEFFLALAILAIRTTVLIVQKTFEQLLNSLGGQPITAPDVLQIIALALVIMAIIDFVRNLTLGYLFPAHAIAHILGELISSMIFFSTILRSAQGLMYYTILEAIPSVCLSIAVMSLGVLIRAYTVSYTHLTLPTTERV